MASLIRRMSRSHLLSFMILFQILVLSGEYLNSVYPLWLGREIELDIRPVDPRSLLRGNYARLVYDIRTLGRELFEPGDYERLRRGKPVYVSLAKEGAGWQPTGASLERPSGGLFIRGRVERTGGMGGAAVRYGIEAFFAPKEKALALEKGLRRGGGEERKAVARIKVAPGGKAALVGVVVD